MKLKNPWPNWSSFWVELLTNVGFFGALGLIMMSLGGFLAQ